MSRALGLEKIARDLISIGLVDCQDHVAVADELERLSSTADLNTLREIARQILRAQPPTWLRFVMPGESINTDYVPSADMAALSWLGPNLDVFLADLAREFVLPSQESNLKAIGDAAEQIVMAALEQAGREPRHVARISDAYGFDIECRQPSMDLIEVKAASEATSFKFHITRHEYETSKKYGSAWRLIQVVFIGDAFLADTIEPSHVSMMRCIEQRRLAELVAHDTSTFKWTDSAEVYPTPESWTLCGLELDKGFKIPGFRK
jgi:hypothetical protein